MQLNESDKADLEQLIDRFTLSSVLAALSEICHEKADHIQTNWQDKNLAREWTRAGKRIDNLTFPDPL